MILKNKGLPVISRFNDNNKTKDNHKGFTIVEVMIVLAIAGLILAVVFIAVPALQRNQRNSARSNDRAYVRNQYVQAISDNGGRRPTDQQLNIRADELNWVGTAGDNTVGAGTCSITTHTNQAACTGAGGTWTGGGRLGIVDHLGAIATTDHDVGDTEIIYNTHASSSNPADFGTNHYASFDSPNAMVLVTGVRCVDNVTDTDGEIDDADVTVNGANRNSLAVFYVNEGGTQVFCQDDTN